MYDVDDSTVVHIEHTYIYIYRIHVDVYVQLRITDINLFAVINYSQI